MQKRESKNAKEELKYFLKFSVYKFKFVYIGVLNIQKVIHLLFVVDSDNCACGGVEGPTSRKKGGRV